MFMCPYYHIDFLWFHTFLHPVFQSDLKHYYFTLLSLICHDYIESSACRLPAETSALSRSNNICFLQPLQHMSLQFTANSQTVCANFYILNSSCRSSTTSVCSRLGLCADKQPKFVRLARSVLNMSRPFCMSLQFVTCVCLC